MKKKRTGKTPVGRRRAAASGPDSAPAVVILAAGVGSRMRSSVPKVLHRMGGRALIHAVMDLAAELSPAATVAVLGAGRERVEVDAPGGLAVVEDLRLLGGTR